MAFQSGGGGFGVGEGESGWLMRDDLSPGPPGVEGKCPWSSAEWWEGHRLACPKLQPRSGVSGEHGRLGRADAKRGLFIAEVAERVSFTVGTTVLPSEARGDGSGALCWWDPFQAWVKPTEALAACRS